MDKRLFVEALAKFLVDDQASKSILLEMGNRLAKDWAELRSKTPLRGYPTTDEAILILSDWLGISSPLDLKRVCGRRSFANSGYSCVLGYGHKDGHDFQPDKPKFRKIKHQLTPGGTVTSSIPTCAWPSGCEKKPLKNLNFCRRHQPFPARVK